MTISQPKIHREINEIFSDLKTLSQSKGALHEISALFYRDWITIVDVEEERVINDPIQRWSTDRLNKNELFLLLGLMVQSTNKNTFSFVSSKNTFANSADKLLREFHDRLISEAMPVFDQSNIGLEILQNNMSTLGREDIYYGADGFYSHQFIKYARHRYKNDSVWLQKNIGLSIRPMLDIASYISKQVNGQLVSLNALEKSGEDYTHGDLTNTFLISKDNLRKKFGQKADLFISKFSTPINNSNFNFINPFSINEINIAPLIDMGDCLYLCSSHKLFETIYDSPFYWMIRDKEYVDQFAKNRGNFLEKTTAHILRSIFGKENVYENVEIDTGAKDISGEIDVLVVYGEYILIVQAKSKRITMKARAGDPRSIKKDFADAIQAPYQQALSCAEFIINGATCRTNDGDTIALPALPRLFPMVILSDHFPASSALADNLLRLNDNIAPVIWDIGMLDCIVKLLFSPIELIYYLKSRSNTFEHIISDNEYNFLGYHLKVKLSVQDGFDSVMLNRDFSGVVDDFMTSIDVGLQPKRPIGILERIQIPVIQTLLKKLKSKNHQAASLVLDFYDFSSIALEDIAKNIINLREEINITGKEIKSFSIPTSNGGITYAVSQNLNKSAELAAEAIGAKHKYDTKSDRWYVILDCVRTKNAVDGLLPLIWKWRDNEEEFNRSQEVGRIFNSSTQVVKLTKNNPMDNESL